jgi:dTDP-4-amino-4,6-dideoxygalactose transaminase
VPLHLQQCFAYLGYKEGGFPESERAAAETVALPIYPELTPAQLDHVVASVLEFYGASARKAAT